MHDSQCWPSAGGLPRILFWIECFVGKWALQILPIVITPVSCCVCMRMCVTFSVNLRSHVAKILKKYSPRWIWTFQSNGASPIFLLLDIHFREKTYGILLLFANISQTVREQTLLLVSDMKLGNSHRMAPLRMLYIVTLTYIFSVTVSVNHIIFNIWKTVRAIGNCLNTILEEFHN